MISRVYTVYALLVLLAVLLAVVISMSITYIPKSSVTVGRIYTIRMRFQILIDDDADLPDDAATLPKIKDKSMEVVDGWGSPFIIKIDDSSVEIRSYGIDLIPSEDDVVGTFARVKSGETQRIDEWIVRPAP